MAKRATPAKRFSAMVHKIPGPTADPLNPCVDVPAAIVAKLKAESRKNQSIPVRATLQGKPFEIYLVKYRGAWRLYLNGVIRKRAAVAVGDKVAITIRFDPKPRVLPVPPVFARALARDKGAKTAFEALPPYRRKEILRYIGNLKREETVKRVVAKTVNYLAGRETGKILVVLAYRKSR